MKNVKINRAEPTVKVELTLAELGTLVCAIGSTTPNNIIESSKFNNVKILSSTSKNSPSHLYREMRNVYSEAACK